jgi:hypothetical protein
MAICVGTFPFVQPPPCVTYSPHDHTANQPVHAPSISGGVYAPLGMLTCNTLTTTITVTLRSGRYASALLWTPGDQSQAARSYAPHRIAIRPLHQQVTHRLLEPCIGIGVGINVHPLPQGCQRRLPVFQGPERFRREHFEIGVNAHLPEHLHKLRRAHGFATTVRLSMLASAAIRCRLARM